MIEPLTRLGILINEMIWRLQKARREPMSVIHAELQQIFGISDPTLYRWREGYSTPEPEQIIQLVRIGVTQARMSAKWAKEMLREGHCRDMAWIDQLFPSAVEVQHNLAGHAFPEFIGRTTELAGLEQRLADDRRHYPLLITGPAGCGKSALAREFAWRALTGMADPARPLSAVVWVTVPAPALLTATIAPADPPLQMADIYRTLDATLSATTLSAGPAFMLPQRVLTVLQRAGRVWLLLDGVENLKPSAWQPWLHTLPATTQVILTSREHLDLPYPVILTAMPPADAYTLAQAEGSAANLRLTPMQLETLATQTYGHPLAIRWVISQIAMRGVNLARALQAVADPQAEFQQFLFAASATRLRADAPGAYRTWGALTTFPLTAGTSLADLATCQGLSIDEVQTHVQLLGNAHLVYSWPDRQGCTLYPWSYPSAACAAAES